MYLYIIIIIIIIFISVLNYVVYACMYVRMCMFYYPKLLLSPISVMHYGKLTNLWD